MQDKLRARDDATWALHGHYVGQGTSTEADGRQLDGGAGPELHGVKQQHVQKRSP